MAAHFEQKEEFFAVRDALSSYTSNWRFIDPTETSSPLRATINNKKYGLLVNLTHDSGNNRPNDDECRIQSNAGQLQKCKELAKTGYDIAVLGFYPPQQVFSMWETTHYFSFGGGTFSMYSRFSLLEEASRVGIATYEFKSQLLKRASTCINFSPELLGAMIENHAALGRSNETELKKLPEKLGNITEKSNEDSSTVILDIGREKVTISRTAYSRSPKFKNSVLEAYGHACCICGVQIGIVEAAHIIPHAEEQGPGDAVQNGLALCAQHHRAYDTGLLIPDEDYKAHINEERLNYLKSINRMSGAETIKAFHGAEMKLPSNKKEWPEKRFLQRGRIIRTGK